MKFVKKLLIYFFGNVFNKLIVFILLPVYTKHFDPISYGENDLAYTTVIMLVAVLFLEPWVALLRFSYDEDGVKGRQRVFTNTIVLSGICFPIYIVGCLAISYIFKLPNVIWMTLFGFSYLLLNIFQFKIRADGHNVDFLISGMISASVQLLSAVVAVFVYKLGAVTVFISPILGNLIACLYICIKNKYFSEFHKSLVEKEYLMRLFAFSYPLAINSIAFWGMTNINRYFARYYLGLEINGYIALATKFTNIVAQLVQVFALAWQESAFEHSNNNDRSRYYSEMFKNYYLIMSLGTSGIMLATHLLFSIFINESYLPTRLTLPIFYISSFLNAISNFYGHLFSAEKKTGILLSSTIFGTITNIVLLIVLMSKIRLFSVPLCLSLGYLVNVILRITNYQKINKLLFERRSFIFGSFIILLCVIVCYIDLQFVTALFIGAITILTLYIFKDNALMILSSIREQIKK